jgi:tetratricopeptide (TPR) repeat protein
MDVAVLVKQGLSLVRRGEIEAAGRCARTALNIAVANPQALNLQAIVLSLQARHAEAADLFRELTRVERDNRDHWMNLGTSLRALQQLDAALDAYLHAAALGAAGVKFHYNVGLLRFDRGEYEAARLALRDAHALSPVDASIAYQYAAACCETFDTQEGLAALRHWSRLQGLTTELIARIGILLLRLGEPKGADHALATALADPSPDAGALLQLVHAFERLNRLTEAREALDRLQRHPARTTLHPDDIKAAEATLAQREERHAVAAPLFGELANNCADHERKHLHLFPLAKSLDALGRHDEAFAAMKEAHVSQALMIERTSPDVVARKSDTMRITRFGCDVQDIAHWDHSGAPPVDQSPIFIVAFPRSGTTLLEQTLDAHPHLQSMDEQPYLQNTIERITGPGVHYPDRMAFMTAAQLRGARDYYWSLVRRSIDLAPEQRLIDKNPLNILRLPVIARLFPHAHIVLAIRHPCDVLVSCYMQLFRPEFAWHCRDIEPLGLAYRRAYDYWYEQSALLRPAVHEIQYEQLVSGFDAEVRQLAEFLHLPWTDAMLAPGEHARDRGLISTPSYSQVVEPVHTRSVDRWRKYESHLSMALPTLLPYLQRWGYAA